MKQLIIAYIHVHCTSTRRDFEVPGQGSPPNFLLERGTVQVIFPRQACKS